MDLAPSVEDGWRDEAAARLYAAILSPETDVADAPHVIVRRCEATGETAFHGPFVSALAALTAADLEERGEHGPEGDRLSIMRLFPPMP